MSSIPHKRCSKCGAEKPLSEFHRPRVAVCKACVNAHRRATYQPKRPPVQDNTHRRCWKCGEWKPLSEYWKARNRPGGIDPKCKDCAREYKRAHKDRFNELSRARRRDPVHERARKKRWRAANPDKDRAQRQRAWRNLYSKPGAKSAIQAYQAVWRRRNPGKVKAYGHNRRAQMRRSGGSYTVEQWDALCAQYGHRCLACGSQEPLTVDHIVPLSKGGTNDITNLQPLCHRCNSAKGDKVIDYREINSDYTKDDGGEIQECA